MLKIARYGAVGILNTAIGYSVILASLHAGLGDYMSNLCGYSLGLICSFFLNRRWTFGVSGKVGYGEVASFGTSFVIAYLVNLTIVATARTIGFVEHPLAHLAAMGGYSVAFYVLSNNWVFTQSNRQSLLRSAFLARHWPELLLCVQAAATFGCLRGIELTHDVAWQFWIARQMLHGFELYRDIWELNPPLWFWSALPIEYVAEILGRSPYQLLIAVMVSMGAGSALLTGYLSPFQKPVERLILMAAIFWFCVPAPLFDFGQREQFALICAIPYAALAARRRDGCPTPIGLAILVGVFSAYGFALKHYFLLVPILVEAWLICGLRRAWKPVRPETIALSAMGVVYAFAVLLLAPEFLSVMVPMVGTAYKGYEVPFLHQLDEPAQLIWILSLISLGFMRRACGRNENSFTSALYLSAIAFAVAYFAQKKGWQYHAIPVTGAILIAVVTRMIPVGFNSVRRFPIAVFSLGFAIFITFFQGSYNDFLRRGSEPILATVHRGEPVAILSADPMWTWPIIEKRGLRWPLHVYSLWMIPSIGHAEIIGPHDPALDRLADKIRSQTLADMRCNPPAVIMFERRRRYLYQPQNFDVTAFFLRDAGIRSFLARNYAEETSTRYFRFFRRSRVIQPEGSGCKRATLPFIIR